MTERKKKHVAHTEDRVKSRNLTCSYPACDGRLTPARIAEGWDYCEEECYYAHLAERDDTPEPEEEE